MFKRNISNIIFDLGGVIINLDTSLTQKAFQNHFSSNFLALDEKIKALNLLENYELGVISSAEFVAFFQQIDALISETKVKACWNSMLLDIPKERIELIRKLSENYNVFLLSNTNEIHTQFIDEYMQQHFAIDSIASLFKKTYLSYQLNLRKPNQQIFQLVLDENSLNPSETIFIDDTKEHIEAAKRVGIQTHHLINQTLTTYFNGN
ncbi:MAG: HAD family phosphatase [Vicingaceae bacterium]|nr:HAD family phosphatase [Vicingaceae bacterium]